MTAPTGGATVYDQQHLSLYAALLDAEKVGLSWMEAATNLMGLDPDQVEVEQCWRSHLDRAHWITGVGLASALEAFGQARNGSDPDP